jgi:hypothetical protein
MFDLPFLFSQYRILESTSHWLSTRDLFNVSLVCRDLHAVLIGSPEVFDHLKRYALCDGSGLKARQSYSGRYKSRSGCRCCNNAEEVEVRVYRTQCDEAGALPCIKCGINVCEECRFVPRFKQDLRSFPTPHLNDTYQLQNIVCYCDACDIGMEEQYGPHLCGCNQYTRWICLQCKDIEDEESWALFGETSQMEWDMEDPAMEGMSHQDHQHTRCVSLALRGDNPVLKRFEC